MLKGLLDSAREPKLSDAENTEEYEECCPSLTITERILFCGLCFGLGMLVNVIAMLKIPRLLLGDPKPFAAAFTLGNILSMSSSLFLVGPVRQFKNMFNETRWIASLLYISSLSATLFFVLYPGIDPAIVRVLLVLVCLVVQIVSYVWYIISYIPFGRRLCKNAACGLLNLCCNRETDDL